MRCPRAIALCSRRDGTREQENKQTIKPISAVRNTPAPNELLSFIFNSPFALFEYGSGSDEMPPFMLRLGARQGPQMLLRQLSSDNMGSLPRQFLCCRRFAYQSVEATG